MDILGAIKSEPVVDLALLVVLGVFFFLGVAQGAIRRLLGILSFFFAFIVAANARDPVGDFLSHNWTQFDAGYNHLLAFGIVFVVAAVALSIVIQGFYKRTDLSADHPIVDDAVGGILGLVQGLLLLLMVAIILNSYVLPPAQPGDLGQVRDLQDAALQSHIMTALRDDVAPYFLRILGLLLPSDLLAIFP
jgi:uncharacterized membrane protein required for colicin V production